MSKFKNFLIGPFEDWKENPILSPTAGFQSKAVYNPSVIGQGDEFLMFYRAEAKDGLTGRIALSRSRDPFHFDPAPEPILVPDQNFDRGGCEDPRVARFEDTYFLFYVGNSLHYHVSNICLAISKDLSTWEKIGRLLKAGKDSWCSGQLKAAVVVPQKMGERYVMYFMGEAKEWISSIGIAYSKDLYHWEEPGNKPVLEPRKDFFDSVGVEPGPMPLVTDEGIVLVYNGWAEDRVYKPGAVLFSREDPARVLKRTEKPLLNLARNYGYGYGTKNHCVAEGLLKYKDQLILYYGAADRLVCAAICKGKE